MFTNFVFRLCFIFILLVTVRRVIVLLNEFYLLYLLT